MKTLSLIIQKLWPKFLQTNKGANRQTDKPIGQKLHAPNLSMRVGHRNSGKKRKCWQPAFSPFTTMFSIPSETNFKFTATFIFTSANAFNFDQSKIF